MDEYWLQLDIRTDRSLGEVVRLVSDAVRLLDLEPDVEVLGAQVNRWDDEDEDVVDAMPVPLGGEHADG